MASAKYKEWLEEDKLILLQGWARNGLTDEQISHNMGIAPKTLWEWKNKYSNIGSALKKGKEVIDLEVENALLKNALDGNITAQIYWLKNRRPKEWRDRVEVETNKEHLEKVEELLTKIKDEANDNK